MFVCALTNNSHKRVLNGDECDIFCDYDWDDIVSDDHYDGNINKSGVHHVDGVTKMTSLQ